MAKKAKKAMKEAPKSKPSSNTGVIVGVIVAIVVIIILVLLLRGGKQAAPSAGPTGPTAPTEAVPAKPTLSAVSPEFEKYCKESAGTTAPTLGYTPCACQLEGDSLKINLLNSGKEDIEGVYFEVKGTTKTIYFSDFNNVAAKETHEYTLSVNEIASQLGEKVTDLIVHASQNKKACLNTRLVILSKASCASTCKSSMAS